MTSHQRLHAARVAAAIRQGRCWTVTRADGLMVRQGGGWTAIDAEALRLREGDATAMARDLRRRSDQAIRPMAARS